MLSARPPFQAARRASTLSVSANFSSSSREAAACEACRRLTATLSIPPKPARSVAAEVFGLVGRFARACCFTAVAVVPFVDVPAED